MSADYITMTIPKQKRIALIAHDAKKEELIKWCEDNKEILSELGFGEDDIAQLYEQHILSE